MVNSRLAIDHVGLSVPDLDTAVAFFQEVFGFELVFFTDPYEDVGWVWPGESEPEKVTLRIAVLQHDGMENIELLEYGNRAKPDRAEPPRPADRGGMHLAFYVEDIYGVEQELRKRNDVRFLSPVIMEEGGPIHGTDWSYILTDWGLTIELIRWIPGELPYEQHTDKRMVAPHWLRQ
jgi:catechol 2,3-dioxygenase-like lactoylglutathione lyase family enzyme